MKQLFLLLIYTTAFGYNAREIGERIFLNECRADPKNLVFWSIKEEFPSLGIGHFIWFPASYKGPFVQTFPALLRYYKKRKIAVPSWLLEQRAAPWSTREEFLADTVRLQELQQFLQQTVDIQIDFMMEQFKEKKHDLAFESKKMMI